MSRQYPVVNVATYTFDMWITRTNDIINLVNTDVVTVASNTTGDFTVGNGTVIGIFGANTLFATELRGGNVTASDVLTVTSNLVSNGDQLIVNSNTYVNAANIFINTSNSVTVVGNTQFRSNTTNDVLKVIVNASSQSVQINVNSGFIVTGNTTLNNALAVNGAITAANTLNVNGAVTLANTLNVAGATTLQSTANVGGALTVTGATQLQSTLGVAAAAQLQSTLSVSGNTTLSNNLIVVGNSYFTGAISVGNSTVNSVVTSNTMQTNTLTTFNLYVTGSIYGSLVSNGSVIPSVNNVFTLGTSSNVYSEVWANSYYGNTVSIGDSYATTGTYTFANTSQVAVDTFDPTVYRTGEYTLQFSNTASGAYHVTKILVYHDGSNAYSAEYAQLFNTTSLATVTCDYSGGNVRILVTPATAGIVAKFTKNLLAV